MDQRARPSTRAPSRSAAAGWLFGLVFYVVYRRFVEGTSLTSGWSVPEAGAEEAEAAESSTRRSWCPCSAPKLDDDIVSTAGRLADAEVEEGEPPPRLDVVYVAEVPLTVPLDAPLPTQVQEQAERALRARARGGRRVRERGGDDESWCGPGRRRRGSSRRRGAEAEVIVMGGEPPSRVRGGAILGGIGARGRTRSGR